MATESECTRANGSESGSVLPLVLGMVTCLLLLGAGITAATSAVLARGNLQHLCDGAAATAADALRHGQLAGTDAAAPEIAGEAALAYLLPRAPDTVLEAAADGDGVRLRCSRNSPITFGALFATPVLHQSLESVGRAVLADR